MLPGLILVLLGACAGGDEADEVDVTVVASDGGKADAIDGRQLRIRTYARVDPWSDTNTGEWAEMADLTRWKRVVVDVATATTAVTSGLWFSFAGTDEPVPLSSSEWAGDRLLRLGVERGVESTARMGFLVREGLYNRTTFTCTHGSTRLNYFESLVINLTDREVYANDRLTFSFAECGIDDGKLAKALAGPDAGKRAWKFEVFVVPLVSTGALTGDYGYKLHADLQ